MQKQKFDEIVSYFNKKVSEMEIETKYKMELLGMVTALGCAHEKETHEKRTETHACDCISRQSAIEAYGDWYVEEGTAEGFIGTVKQLLEGLPSAQPKRKKGEWVDNETSFADGVRQTCTCSVCGLRSVRPLGQFCRWCGADMRGEQNE